MWTYITPFIIAAVVYVECRLLAWYSHTHPTKENEHV